MSLVFTMAIFGVEQIGIIFSLVVAPLPDKSDTFSSGAKPSTET
jgi:hypothetical protein